MEDKEKRTGLFNGEDPLLESPRRRPGKHPHIRDHSIDNTIAIAEEQERDVARLRSKMPGMAKLYPDRDNDPGRSR